MRKHIYEHIVFFRILAVIPAFIISLTYVGSAPAQSGDTPSDDSRIPIELGGKISINGAQFNDFTSPQLSPGFQAGAMVGAFFRIGLSWVAFQPELLFISKGSDVLLESESVASYRLSYLSLPLLARGEYPIAPLLDSFLLVGPAFNIAISSELENKTGPMGNTGPMDNMENTKRLDVGMVVGAGLGFDAWKNITVLVEARYEHGLSDVLKSDGTTTNRTIFVTFGAAWSRDKDSDRDGIANHLDIDRVASSEKGTDATANKVASCWKKAEDFDGFNDNDGCPEPDNDGDGIADAADECTNEGEDIDDFQDDNGCPEPDNDGDLVLDVDDKCPNVPFNSVDGCPRKYQWISKITDQGIELAQPFDGFEVKKAELSELHKKILADLAKVLNDYPDMRLRIRGHADGEGSKKENEKFSQNRADAVRNYLIEQGVDEDRLISKGEGEDYPIKQEDKEEGKKRNRRVEFEILREE